ncbi:MAG: hypothetical protein JAY90_21865 [Candidatus Thiodiazotropha lotti]|nr:hypothetical protein [Candidatus Thiodiazotropha lotti]
MNQQLWQPNDKAWVKQRREEWKKIVKSLDAIGYINKKNYKYHKDYFFKGPSSIDEALLPPKVFDSGKLIFKMWYHPVVSLEAYQGIFNACPSERSQEALFKFNSASKRKIKDEDYGLMGGREKLMIKALFPSYDFDDVTYCERDGVQHGPVHLAPTPGMCLSYVLNALIPMFRVPDVNPYSPGQYLMDHLDHCIDKIDFTDDAQSGEKERLIEVIHLIKHQSKYPKFQKDRKSIVAVANQLKARFENREFGPILMEYWDHVDDLYEEYLGS